MQREQVFVPAEDEIGVAADRQLQKLVVGGVAAGSDRPGSRHALGCGQERMPNRLHTLHAGGVTG